MKNLWAPWRIKYILNKKDKNCIFCQKSQENKDEKNYIIWRGQLGFIIMNIFPYNNGHLMVAPYRHVAEPSGLKENELLEMMLLLRKSIEVLKKVLKPDGFNIGINLGKIAGAGVEDHFHIHIVPRWLGDTNFMPVIADTKVMPEHLRETYKKLKETL